MACSSATGAREKARDTKREELLTTRVVELVAQAKALGISCEQLQRIIRKDLSMSLVISDLSKSRHGTSLLNGVNLELRSGAIHGLFGRNGAGKSTLLNIIANRLVADAGSVSFDGNRMTDGGGM